MKLDNQITVSFVDEEENEGITTRTFEVKHLGSKHRITYYVL